jgi:DNA-binding response OmpR family regulator
VSVDKKKSELTSTEFDLLYFLMIHPEIIFTSQQLLQQVWNYPLETADIGLVRWHMKNLRSKIEVNPEHPIYLITVSRQGYILKGNATAIVQSPNANARPTLIPTN